MREHNSTFVGDFSVNRKPKLDQTDKSVSLRFGVHVLYSSIDCHSFTPSLLHSFTPSLFHSVTPSLFHPTPVGGTPDKERQDER